MSRAFNREYRDAPTPWDRCAHVCIGLAAIFAIVRWWVSK